jgi:purine nucleosidase
VRVAGNVEQPGHDGSAEWNFFNQPQAAAVVVGSGVPITLVPLDATNKVPLTRRFLDQLGAQSSAASQLAVQAWRLAANQPGTDQYYFWDTLTAAVMLDPSIAKTENLKISVVTAGASQGRTREDPHGNPVQVAVDARQDRVERLFLDVLGR